MLYHQCMKKTSLFPLLFILFSTHSMGSAGLKLDEEQRLLTIVAKLHFYGNHATAEVARATVEEIESMWNEPNQRPYHFPRGAGAYQVRFEIDWEILSTSDAESRIPFEKNCINNYVRVEYTSGVMTEQTRSSWITGNPFMKWMFGNNGYFNVRDDLGTSTTAVHEFGHGLGLDHSAPVIKGQPGIMAARGTHVDSEFQVDPHAKQGQPGGTIDVKKRKVLRSEVEAVLANVVDIKMIGKEEPQGGPRVLGTPINPNCLGGPSDMAFDAVGNPIKLPLK
jgi:hypothetical protein